jgi:hypothetical protein
VSTQSHAQDLPGTLAAGRRRRSIAPDGVTGNARLTALTGHLS